ncbi:hypothetical protein LTS08_002511 [Lithohypha guttulata]|nr:hypothetical protein LTS08_002511 [Lithohypha guttulata]
MSIEHKPYAGMNDPDLQHIESRATTNHDAEPELEKKFSVWSLGSLCLCLMATWEALSTVVAQALVSGGAPCLFYNYLISFFGSMAIVTSLAEMASMYPSAAGQYHWVARISPAKGRRISSWFTAWISIGGQIVLTASAAFAGGLQLQALITLNNVDTYIPQRWQGMLFYDLVLVYALAINIFGIRILSLTNEACGLLHIIGFVVVFAVLAAMAPKRDADFVFVESSNLTGWPNDGIAWLIGLLSTTYAFLGYDSAAHLSEELPRPERYVPLAMVGSVVLNGLIGFAYCLMLLFSLGDLDTVLASPFGFPYIQVFFDATRSRAGATVLSLIPSLIAVAANAAGLTSTSRTAWALARDNATPKAAYLAHIDSKFHVPVRMIVVVTVLQFLLGFIYLGNTTAFNAILTMAIIGMYVSYALPIVYMLFFGRKPGAHESGPFRLGRAGPAINIVALIWLVVAIFFSTWPNFYPVTPVNMNYSTVVLAGWVLFGASYYLISGRHKYRGPVLELDGLRRSETGKA